MYKLGVLVLIAAVAANDLAVGPKSGGKKIYDQKLEASPAIWRQDKNFTFNATNGDVISRVIITDLRPEKDGEAKIVEGGEGHNNVTIELMSPAVFRGFEFNVEVYVAQDNNQQSVAVGQETTHDSPQVPAQEPKVSIFVTGDASDDSQQSVSTEQQNTQQTSQVSTQEPKVPISVVGDDSDNKQQSVSQVPTQEPKLSVSIGGNNDNLRKTRKTEEQDKQDNVTSKVSASESTTASAAPASSEPTSVPTTQGQKQNDGQKAHIPAYIGTDAKPCTPIPEPVEKDQSDVVDPVAVNNQPTHLNNTEKFAPKQEVLQQDSKHPQVRDSRRTQSTTEAEVTSTTTGFVEQTTTIDGVLHGFRIPNVAPSAYSQNANGQVVNPTKTGSAKNSQVVTHQMAPLPYNH